MEWSAPPDLGPLRGTGRVPASKSLEQRCRVLAALCEPAPVWPPGGEVEPGEDVRHLRAALTQLGSWSGRFMGVGRRSLRLDAGEGATGLRLLMPLAALRPPGARTLLTGRPGLRRRSHRPVARALERLGARLARRHSGAWRVHGGGLRGEEPIVVDARETSHAASALALVGWRLEQGLNLRLLGPVVSRPYLALTLHALERFGLQARLEAGPGSDLRLHVPAGEVATPDLDLPPDASAAASLCTAAVLSGGSVRIERLLDGPPQADTAMLELLERAGARVVRSPCKAVEVYAPAAGALQSPGSIELRDAPDLIFLAGVVAAVATGSTLLKDTQRTRGKESDREAVLLRALDALGIAAEREPQARGLRIRGGAPRAATLASGGDHRAAFAFGALALRIPDLIVSGAACVGKSHPGFWAEVERLGRGA